MNVRMIIAVLVCLVGLQLPGLAQQKGDFRAGLNLASAPYFVFEPDVEYFFWNSISLHADVGYCFNRSVRTMRTVKENVLGGFAMLGPRFYFFPEEKVRSFVGIGAYYGSFRRQARVEIDHYFGTYMEEAESKQQTFGWYLNLGVHFKLGRWALEPALRYTVIGSRDDVYNSDYWTPGVGRAGLARSQYRRKRNFGFLPVLQVKFNL